MLSSNIPKPIILVVLTIKISHTRGLKKKIMVFWDNYGAVDTGIEKYILFLQRILLALVRNIRCRSMGKGGQKELPENNAFHQ